MLISVAHKWAIEYLDYELPINILPLLGCLAGTENVNRMKTMKKGLKAAARIRRGPEGRHHSKSTELARADRSFSDESLAEKDLALENLVANVTEDNNHPEIDFGPPKGEEEW